MKGLYQRNKIWYIDFYANGRRVRERIGENRKLAESVLQKRKTQVIEGKFFDIERVQRIKLEEFSKLYIETYSKPNKASWDDDQIHLNHFLKCVGNIYLEEITPMKLEGFKKWRLEQKVKNTTVNRSLQTIRAMLYRAIEWGYLKENPMKKVKLFKEDTRRLRFLEQEDIEKLLNSCSAHIRNIVVFALNTGMRRGEIFNLKWIDADIRNSLIYIHKTKSKEKRVLPMNQTVKRLLLNIKEHSVSEYVFCSKEGNQARSIKTGFTKALARAGINDFRFHDLRHTFASHLVMNGVDLNTVKELLGHKNYEMTLRYAHLSQDHKAKAVDILSSKMVTNWSQVAKSENDGTLYSSQIIDSKDNETIAPVAQLDSASGYGPEGWVFKSPRARFNFAQSKIKRVF